MFKSDKFVVVVIALLCLVNISLCQDDTNNEDTNVTGELDDKFMSAIIQKHIVRLLESCISVKCSQDNLQKMQQKVATLNNPNGNCLDKLTSSKYQI